MPLVSFNTNELMNEDEAAAPPRVSVKPSSLLSPAAFEMNVTEPICWKLAAGVPVTEVPETARTLLNVVWGLSVAFVRVVTAALFEVAPSATTAKVVEPDKVNVIEPRHDNTQDPRTL